jgi:acyl-CoA reductase-like NAD-dependent aldehyde dehydrogenase
MTDLPTAKPGTLSPADLKPLSDVKVSTKDDVVAAVKAARAAQVSWAETPRSQREKILKSFVPAILNRREEGMKVMCDETGRDPVENLMSDLVSIGDFVNMVINASRKALATEPIGLSPLNYPGKRAYIEAVPRGVIGIIAPWNYPAGNFWKSVLPALLSGNAVVLKPSEHTPRTGLWVADVLRSVFPKDLVQVVVGDGSIGSALLESGIDGIVFTGSVPSGRKVAARAGELLIPCSVELGGKDAAIVLADCDLERTVAGIAQWGFHNAGQNCAAIERVYVEEAIADTFIQRLGAFAAKLRVAPGAPVSDFGPVQNTMQLAIVERHVKEAVDQGAKVVAGGSRTGPGLGFQATVLDRCTQKMSVVADETFGPVLAVVRVKDADEAVRLANDSRYGLNGSVWTKDIKRGEALARKLEVGVALVNNHGFTGIIPELPWTGVKETGPGVANSRHAYSTFVRRRAVLVDKNKNPDPWWMPADENSKPFSEALARAQMGQLSALLDVVGLLGKRLKSIKTLAGG